jgi:two-component system sensor histidine kinase BaeS
MQRTHGADNVSHEQARLSQDGPELPSARDQRPGALWIVARWAGEILALVALFLSAVALVVVLDDADASGSLREQFALLLVRLADQATLATVIVLLVALVLAVALALTVRIRDQARARADQLVLDLGTASKQVARLERILATRDELLLAVVHELRTPLTHVVGYAELLSSGSRPRLPQEIGEMSTAIQSASATMLRLMDDLAEATRAQADGFSLKARPVDLVHLIRGIAAAYDVQGDPHRLSVDLPDHWLAVLADPERIHQVLGNLLTNAITYSPNGGEVRVRARALGDHVRVEVEDHGIGMAPEDQRRAFDRFYRAREGRALREHGSGLGLAIVKDLIQAHGGQVGVTSQPGLGSTFWFTLRTADEPAVNGEPLVASHRTAPASPSA